MNIGDIGENMIKVSETNITHDGGSILQPDNVVNKETKKKNNELEKEIKEIRGEDVDDNENSDDDSNSGNSGGGKKILKFELK